MLPKYSPTSEAEKKLLFAGGNVVSTGILQEAFRCVGTSGLYRIIKVNQVFRTVSELPMINNNQISE